ncbi:5863_t:CDS:2, partial [Racocetra persica]
VPEKALWAICFLENHTKMGLFILQHQWQDSVTDECCVATMSIDGLMYNIVDTPGIFDTKKESDTILTKISKAVNQCAFGVKAILIVFEAKRFTQEQKDVLNEIRTFLGRDATNHIIAVFSHATKTQTEFKDRMQNDWNTHVKSFVQNIGYRWGISPNPDIFPSDNQIHKERLNEIKQLIKSIQGVYTTEQLEVNLREQERIRRQKEEDERKKKQEYEEKLKEKARRETEEAYKRQMKEAEEAQRRQMKEIEESHRRQKKEAEEAHRRQMSEMREAENARWREQAKKEREEKAMKEGLGFTTGATTGALAGSVAGPIGAAIGGAVGGAVGWL